MDVLNLSSDKKSSQNQGILPNEDALHSFRSNTDGSISPHPTYRSTDGGSVCSSSSYRSRQATIERKVAERYAEFHRSRSLFEKNVGISPYKSNTFDQSPIKKLQTRSQSEISSTKTKQQINTLRSLACCPSERDSPPSRSVRESIKALDSRISKMNARTEASPRKIVPTTSGEPPAPPVAGEGKIQRRYRSQQLDKEFPRTPLLTPVSQPHENSQAKMRKSEGSSNAQTTTLPDQFGICCDSVPDSSDQKEQKQQENLGRNTPSRSSSDLGQDSGTQQCFAQRFPHISANIARPRCIGGGSLGKKYC